jgi:hypothetical protein
LRKRVPAPPPFLSMNSIPAASRALRIAAIASGETARRFRSKSSIVELKGQGPPRRRAGLGHDPLIIRNAREYEDLATSFVVNEASAWSRPVGVTVMPGGAPHVSDEARGSIGRVGRSCWLTSSARSRTDGRRILNRIIYVLKIGCRWVDRPPAHTGRC